MGEPADAGGRIGDRARLLLGERDQLRQRADPERRIDGEEHRVLGREAERDEVARQLQRQIGRDAGQRDEVRQCRHVQRIAVGQRLGGGTRADAAAAARPIDRDDLLLPDPAQALGEEARIDVGRAARRRVADDGDRLGRVVLGVRDAHRGGEHEASPNDRARRLAPISPFHAWSSHALRVRHRWRLAEVVAACSATGRLPRLADDMNVAERTAASLHARTVRARAMRVSVRGVPGWPTRSLADHPPPSPGAGVGSQAHARGRRVPAPAPH